jgi:calcineurin-like phosphoesterase family protein
LDLLDSLLDFLGEKIRMKNIWFISDTHFNHPSIIIHSRRPFYNIEDMNEWIIKEWNKKISKSDTIYHLGDFAFGKLDEIKKIRYRLNGKINLILGNHDYKNHIQRLSDCFTDICDLKTIKINKQKIILCHYSMNVWDSSHYNSWHLYGHSHGTYQANGKCFDVGVDNHNYTPWEYSEIVEKMNTLPDNFNFIEHRKFQ